jgi:hypothetical protein
MNRKTAKESLTADSTTEEFILETAKSIADFIVLNRTAFSTDDREAVEEFITACGIADIKEKAIEFIQNPQPVENTEETEETATQQEDTQEDTQEDLPEETGTGDDSVPQEVLDLLDK